jgi:DNA-binding beta-propeller fold protein YncE
MDWKFLVLAAAGMTWAVAGWSADMQLLQVEAKIPLGAVNGRIDHLAVDLTRQRLFVAELGNDTVGVVDLKERTVLRTLTGFAEPQGIGYEPGTDAVYVANGDDGSVHILRGEDFSPVGQIDLGDDADNVRIDAAARRVYVGYGSGTIAIIDPESRARMGSIDLKAHPEGFRLDPAGPRVYVNVPRALQIAVLDRASGRQVASWPTDGGIGNFPMALDPENQRVLAVFRAPAKLKVFSLPDGKLLANVSTCGDADDVFLDAKRQRIYVIGGEGYVDVHDNRSGNYERVARLETVSGARTALFVPEWDRLFVAVRAADREPAAVWVIRPLP